MNKRRLFWGGLLVLFSVLFFVALSAGFVDTLFDYRTFSGINGSAKFGVSWEFLGWLSAIGAITSSATISSI